MLVEFLAKNLAKRLNLKLILFGLSVQIVALFRSYPPDHPCGRVLEINSTLSVLINCDSAVYMKDAQDPMRLVDGQSVYQDRPLPTFLVAFLAKIWHTLNLPDYYRQIQGNSGQTVTYSLVTYALFLILSLAILSLTIHVGLKSLMLIQYKVNVPYEIFASVAFLYVTVISMNELTKTFFWTPGSQMFNLLLPVYAFYLTFFTYQPVSDKSYLFHVFIVSLLIFSYAFFVLLLIPLLLSKWSKLKTRILITCVPIILYLSYPFLLNLFGGRYNNFAFGYRRFYVWVIDAYREGVLGIKLGESLGYFVKSFPFFPIITLLITITIFTLMEKKVKLNFRSELTLLSAHVVMIGLYGYYSRRLTLPIVITLFMFLLKMFFGLKHQIQIKVLQPWLFVSVLFIVCSWIFTLGPLI